MHYTDLTRSGNMIMYMEIIEIYLLFKRSCTINGLKPRVCVCVCVCVCVGGGGLPYICHNSDGRAEQTPFSASLGMINPLY